MAGRVLFWLLIACIMHVRVTDAQGPCGSLSYSGCVKEFSRIITGSSYTNNPTAMYQRMCSPAGKDAWECVLKYVNECPQLTQLTGLEGIDLSMFTNRNAIESTCEVLVGKCGGLANCITKIPTDSAFRYDSQALLHKMTSTPSSRLYEILPIYLSMLCGSLKPHISCVAGFIDTCPSIANQVNTGLHITTTDVTMPTTRMDVDFVRHRCTYKGEFENKKTCVKNQLASTNFTNCFNAAQRQTSGHGTCGSYQTNKQCMMQTVGQVCGNDVGEFMASGLPLFYQELPHDCDYRSSGIRRHLSIFALVAAMLVYVLIEF